MARIGWAGAWLTGALGVLLAFTSPLTAQVIRGTVLDAKNDRPVPMAAVQLMDGDRNSLLVAMSDSLGRYALVVPDSGAYFLVAQRFGYEDMVSPLLAISGSRAYDLDLELRPEPLGLGEITVTVRNEQAVAWLTREFGVNPSGAFGFRLLQGDRLAAAKVKGKLGPTETLRWLYVPVSHGPACVSINSTPRAVRGGWRGPRQGPFGEPGSAPAGTASAEKAAAAAAEGSDRCGSLMVNDRPLPNEDLESIDMSSIAVIVTLPGVVRMYTYDFDWTFR
jgi:hypothetical protein